jgi:hypothetical protein
MASEREPRLWILDVAEALALVLVPAVVFGVSVAVLSGGENLPSGLFVGGIFGAILARYRGAMVAVRTEDGIERRLKSYSTDPEDNPWVRAANIEYDEKYDRVLVVVFAAVGIAALGAIPFVDDELFMGWLAIICLIGIAASVMTYGARQRSA